MSCFCATLYGVMKMQMNRLFEIIYILLSKKTVTARELAERFEVSRRTIYRDIDTLSLAGIPIYTSKGKGGGIGLLDEFVLDRSVLSESEQNEILYALQGLSAVKTEETEQVLKKLGAFWSRNVTNWIEVDFSDWSCLCIGQFHPLKTAIIDRYIIEFDYYNSYGEKAWRRIEPVQLWFKHRGWYIKGFCLDKNDIRLFKLTRMKNLTVTDETFPKRNLPENNTENMPEENSRPDIRLTLKISPEMTYRVYDEFDENQITKNVDSSFTVTVTWPEDEWVYGFILSFGEFIKVLEPEYIKAIIKGRLQNSLKKYL